MTCKCCPLPQGDPIEYPPLSAEEKRVIGIVANGICVSSYSLQWAFHKGDFKGIRERLLSKPLRMVRDGGTGTVQDVSEVRPVAAQRRDDPA